MDANQDLNNAKKPENWGANRNDPWKDGLNSSGSPLGDALIDVPLDEQPPEEAWLFDQWLMLGWERCQTQAWELALEAFHQALTIDPTAVPALHSQAIAHNGLGSFAVAVPVLEDLLAQPPRDPNVWGNYGHALSGLGRHGEALRAYQQCLKLQPDWAIAWQHLGKTYQLLNDGSAAQQAYRQALNLDESLLESWYGYATLCRRNQQPEEALSAYGRVLALDPNHKEAWNYQGVLLEAQSRHQEALNCYDQAIALDDTYDDAWNNRGIALEHQENWSDAMHAFEHSLACNDRRPDVWNNYGLALDGLGDLRRAIQGFDRALILSDRQYWRAWVNRGWSLWKDQGYGVAIENWETGLTALRTIQPDYRLGAGMLLYHKGRGHSQFAPTQDHPLEYWQAAIACFDQALGILTPDQHTQWHLQVLQDAIVTCRDAQCPAPMQTYLQQGTELLRQLTREATSTERKIELASQLANFYQLAETPGKSG